MASTQQQSLCFVTNLAVVWGVAQQREGSKPGYESCEVAIGFPDGSAHNATIRYYKSRDDPAPDEGDVVLLGAGSYIAHVTKQHIITVELGDVSVLANANTMAAENFEMMNTFMGGAGVVTHVDKTENLLRIRTSAYDTDARTSPSFNIRLTRDGPRWAAVPWPAPGAAITFLMRVTGLESTASELTGALLQMSFGRAEGSGAPPSSPSPRKILARKPVVKREREEHDPTPNDPTPNAEGSSEHGVSSISIIEDEATEESPNARKVKKGKTRA